MIGFPIFRFLSFPISFLFPGYKSFRAVISKDDGDDTRWLIYWVICGAIFFLEAALGFVIQYVPFYYEIKCAFLLVLQWDSAKLANQLYQTYIGPFLDKAEPKIDEFIESYSQQAVMLERRAKEEAAKQMLKAALKSE